MENTQNSNLQSRGPTVELEYNVYIFSSILRSEPDPDRKFYEEKHKMQLKKINNQPIRKTHDENDYMSYDTLEEFNSRKRWKLKIDNDLKNPKFYACISSHHRKTFSIK